MSEHALHAGLRVEFYANNAFSTRLIYDLIFDVVSNSFKYKPTTHRQFSPQILINYIDFVSVNSLRSLRRSLVRDGRIKYKLHLAMITRLGVKMPGYWLCIESEKYGSCSRHLLVFNKRSRLVEQPRTL